MMLEIDTSRACDSSNSARTPSLCCFKFLGSSLTELGAHVNALRLERLLFALCVELLVLDEPTRGFSTLQRLDGPHH